LLQNKFKTEIINQTGLIFIFIFIFQTPATASKPVSSSVTSQIMAVIRVKKYALPMLFSIALAIVAVTLSVTVYVISPSHDVSDAVCTLNSICSSG
jgi:hypothetical protein